MSLESFGRVLWAAEEIHTSPAYGWDNTRGRAGHENHLVAQYTLEGAAFFRDKRGERRVPAGSVMLFTLQEPTSYGYPKGAREIYRHRFIAFSPAPSLMSVFQQLRTDFDSVLAMPLKSPAELLFRELFTRFCEKTFDDRVHESELAYRFFSALYREQMQDTHATDPIEYAYHYLRSHFRSPVNLKIIAEKSGVSREHLSRVFSQRWGESPGSMLRRLRLEHAHAMLSATALTVEEVALASGYTSLSSMARAFRLRYGQSPRGKK